MMNEKLKLQGWTWIVLAAFMYLCMGAALIAMSEQTRTKDYGSYIHAATWFCFHIMLIVGLIQLARSINSPTPILVFVGGLGLLPVVFGIIAVTLLAFIIEDNKQKKQGKDGFFPEAKEVSKIMFIIWDKIKAEISPKTQPTKEEIIETTELVIFQTPEINPDQEHTIAQTPTKPTDN